MIVGLGCRSLRRVSMRNFPVRWNSEGGFTLIELMITLVILAVLLGIGVPMFQEGVLNSKLSSYANDLVASATFARGEAVKRNSRVGMCASSNGTACSGNWEQGWMIYHDANNNGSHDSGEVVLERQGALATGYKITSSGDVIFEPTGFGSTSRIFTICRQLPSVGGHERIVTLNSTGRLSVTKTSNSSCP